MNALASCCSTEKSGISPCISPYTSSTCGNGLLALPSKVERKASTADEELSCSKPEEAAERLLTLYDEKGVATIVSRLLEAHPLLRELLQGLDSMAPVTSMVDQVTSLRLSESMRKLSSIGATALVAQADSSLELGEQRDPFTMSSKASSATPTMVQFNSSVYYCREEDGEVTIDVVRMGYCKKRSSVAFRTVDGSAKAWKKYVPLEGVLEYEPGEIMKEFTLQVINDDSWDATLEFIVELFDPEATSLGENLNKCRVKIIDNDAFPTNKFRDLCNDKKFSQIPKAQLLVEYFKMNWSKKPIRINTMKLMMFDMLDNIYKVWYLLCRLYMIDYLLSSEDDFPVFNIHKGVQLVGIGAFLFIPQLLRCTQEKFRVDGRVGGKTRTIIQTNLLRKFMNYEETTRSTVRESDLVMSMNYDCFAVVADGYLTLIGVFKELMGLVLIAGYQLGVGASKQDGAGATAPTLLFALIPATAIPIGIAMFLGVRHRHAHEALKLENAARLELNGCVEMIVKNVSLIAAFSKREIMIVRCEAAIRCLNDAICGVMYTNVVNKAFVPLFTSFLCAVYISVAGRLTMSGHMSVGLFLTNLDAYTAMARAWNKIYNKLLVINAAFPAMERLTRFLNLPIDLERRHEANLMRREIQREERLKSRELMAKEKQSGIESKSLYASDRIPLKLIHVGFQYDPVSQIGSRKSYRPKDAPVQESWSNRMWSRLGFATDQARHSVNLRQPSIMEFHRSSSGMIGWDFEIPQGSLVALFGRHGDGKGTLLKIIGGVLLPTSGDFFAPPQLRIYFVTQQPLFIYANLKDNLCFGLSKEDLAREEETHFARTIQICLRLGVDGNILNMLNSNSRRDWTQLLPHSQIKLLHLARCLIANPEVLAIEKPTAGFDESSSQFIMGVLREHIEGKGLAVRGNVMSRPRTVVFATERASACRGADLAFKVNQKGAEPVAPASITNHIIYN